MSKHKFYIIIPLRRGSKRIKNKNTILIKNKMLFEYTLDKIIINKFFYKTFINSNDKTIKNWALKNKISFLDRSKKNQGDKSTTESVILETIKKKKDEILFDKNSHIILLQCTSPLRNKNDLENCIKHYINGKFDSLFSGFVSKNLFWGKNKKKLTPVNYNLFNRKREQEMNEQIIENGSIYIFNLLKFLKYKNRLFENIGVYLMNKINSMQVDEKEDLEILEKFI